MGEILTKRRLSLATSAMQFLQFFLTLALAPTVLALHIRSAPRTGILAPRVETLATQRSTRSPVMLDFLKQFMPKSLPTDAAVTSTVFLDMAIGGKPAGRIEIGLYGGVVPKTAENFRQLCTGE